MWDVRQARVGGRKWRGGSADAGGTPESEVLYRFKKVDTNAGDSRWVKDAKRLSC
jgi:hypothetical protein